MGLVIISIIGVIIGIIFLVMIDRCGRCDTMIAICGIVDVVLTEIWLIVFIFGCINYFTTTAQLNEYQHYHEYLHDARRTDLSQTAIELKIMEYNKEIAEWKGKVEIAPWLYWKSDEIMNLKYFSLEEVQNDKNE